MNTLSKRERTLIGVMLGVAVAIGVPGLLLSGSRSARASLPAERARHQKIRDDTARVRAEVAGLRRQVVSRTTVGTPRHLVPRMVRSTHRAARTAGVQLDDLKPVHSAVQDGVQEVAVQLSAHAAFPRAIRFLYELQRERRFHIEQLQMNATSPLTDDLQLEVRLVAYVKSEDTHEVP